jgi:hypothetical protein
LAAVYNTCSTPDAQHEEDVTPQIRKTTDKRTPKPLPPQPKHDCLLEKNNFNLTVEESKRFVIDDGSAPSDDLVDAVRRHADLFKK